MKTNNEIKVSKDEFYKTVINSEKITSIPECVDICMNNIIDLMLDVSTVYMDIMKLQINDIVDIFKVSKFRILTKENTSPMAYEELMIVNNIRYEVAIDKIKALKGDYSELNFDSKYHKNGLKLFLEKRALIECLCKDMLYILLGLKGTVKSENIIKHLKLPEILCVYNIDISRCDNECRDTLYAMKHLVTNSQQVFSTIKDFREQCTNKLKTLITILHQEICDVIKPMNDIFEQYTLESNKCCNNIKNVKNIELEENKETDIQENQEFKYIDNYKELTSLAKSRNCEYSRDINNYGIFKDSKGHVIIIPQDRIISKDLSIKIQKIIMGK